MPVVASIQTLVDKAFLEIIRRNKRFKKASISSSSLKSKLEELVSEKKGDSILNYADRYEHQGNIEQKGLERANDHVERNEKARGALKRAESIFIELEELASEAASSGTTGARRQELDDEAQNLVKELSSLVNTTRVKGKKILEGQSVSFKMGDDTVSFRDIEISSVTTAVGGIDLSSQNSASNSLGQIDQGFTVLDQKFSYVDHNLDKLQRAVDLGEEEAVNLYATATSIRIGVVGEEEFVE